MRKDRAAAAKEDSKVAGGGPNNIVPLFVTKCRKDCACRRHGLKWEPVEVVLLANDRAAVRLTLGKFLQMQEMQIVVHSHDAAQRLCLVRTLNVQIFHCIDRPECAWEVCQTRKLRQTPHSIALHDCPHSSPPNAQLSLCGTALTNFTPARI